MSPENLNYSKALYIDTELTCWHGFPPENHKSEVIQIGICEVELSSLEISRCIRYYVKPFNKWEISSYCTELTGITHEQVSKLGRPFNELGNTITKEWAPKNKMIHTWGDDIGVLEDAAKSASVKSPWGRNISNLSYAFRSAFNLKRNLSLENALNYLGLEFEGKPHDALIDARNTARLHIEMLKRLRQTTEKKAI